MSRGPKSRPKLTKYVFSPFFPYLKSNVSSTMPENREKLSGWLGLLVWAILDEPGKPFRPFGGPEMGPKSIKIGFF